MVMSFLNFRDEAFSRCVWGAFEWSFIKTTHYNCLKKLLNHSLVWRIREKIVVGENMLRDISK